MSLDIAPLLVEGTEDGALPSRGDFVSIRMPRCRVWRFCTSLRQGGERTLRCLRRFLQRRGSFQQSLVTNRRRFSPTLAPWRMTALIATTIDTMTTTITSRAAIMEPKNRAASTNPTTADAINPVASAALSLQNRRGGERISCASGFVSCDRMIWKRVMVAPLPVYSRRYHSVRVQDLVSRAEVPPFAVPIPM